MKQYYRVIDKIDGQLKIETWHGDNLRANWLLRNKFQVLPLGTQKPKNVSRETIKEF